MKFTAQVKPITYLKKLTAEIIEEISETRQPIIITQNGLARLVLMDVKSYEEQKETIALLKILAMGNHEIGQGKYSSADDFLINIKPH